RHGGPLAAVTRSQGAGRDRHGRKQARRHGAEMRPLITLGAAAAIAAAGLTLLVDGPRSRLVVDHAVPVANAADAKPIYFQDPDGKPFYSLTPKKAADGRDWRAIPPGGDV